MRLFFVLTLLAIVGSIAADPPKEEKKLKVEIAKGKLTINGKALAVPGDLSDYEKAFGKSSGVAEEQISKAFNNTYWKDLGISVVQSQRGKMLVTQVRFCFDEDIELATNTPTKPFAGEVFIDGQQVTKTMSQDDVMKKFKNGQNAFGEWGIEYPKSTFKVTINHSEKGTGSVTLAEKK